MPMFNPVVIGGGRINIAGNVNAGSGGVSTSTVTSGGGLFGGAETTTCVNGNCETTKEEGRGHPLLDGIKGVIGKIFHKDGENQDD